MEPEYKKEGGQAAGMAPGLEAGQKYLTQLRRILVKRFDEGELRTLCFDLGVDYESLPVEGKANKARELVAYCDRHNFIHKLLEAGKQLRPDISWQGMLQVKAEIPSASQSPPSEPLQLKKCVLVVEDELNWQELISELLQEVASELGYTVVVVIASSFAEALNRVKATSYDCVTVDNKLLDGKMGRMLIDRIGSLDYRVPVVVISGKVKPSDVGDFFQDYKIDGFFWKGKENGEGFDPRKFKSTMARLLAPVKENDKLQELQNKQLGDTHMDWNTLIGLAVSVVSPYAIALATSAATAAGKELVETASESIKGLWQWIRQTISESDDESAEQVWENFKQNPQSNRNALVDIILRISPCEDATLRGYVQGVIHEVERREAAQLYTLLETCFTLNDARKVASRINPQWEDELGSDPNKTKLATWVISYAKARKQLPDLIAAMLEVNPTVVLQ